MITPRDFNKLAHYLDKRLKTPKQAPSFRYATDTILAHYNAYQSIDKYYPEIHNRLDAESYMANKRAEWNLIEYRLEDGELDTFETWVKENKVGMASSLNYCAEKEIKVSFTFSEKQAAWCISLTGKEDNKLNSGSTLTTWSDDPLDALLMAVFKATVIFSDGVWKTRKSNNRG
jgi:hypothetical protein